MKLEFSLAQEFGTHLADGARAAEFRMARIEPYMDLCEEITLDFTGVRHANSSFVNLGIYVTQPCVNKPQPIGLFGPARPQWAVVG